MSQDFKQTDVPLGKPDLELRERAEKLLLGKLPEEPEILGPLPVWLDQQVIHELQVHQIELEMQNEELQRTQLELERSREEYFDLYELAPVGYLTQDQEGRILNANITAATLLGTEKSHLLLRRLTPFILPEDAGTYYLRRKQLLETGEPQVFELRMVRKDGTVLWAGVEAVATPGSDETSACRLVLSDITDRKRAEEDRRRLDERASHVQKLVALGDLVAGVSHNMNNVLAAIMATASAHGLTASHPEDVEAYAMIDTACRRGRSVVKSLMQFSRPTVSNLAPVDLHALITEVRCFLENTIHNRIQIVESFAGEPLWVHGEDGSLNHVLMNLCLNALDASPDGGRLTLRTDQAEPGWVTVFVQDRGQGMSPEVLARAIEPFFTTKPVGQGTGLGLSMSHGVIQAHGGTLELSSRPGEGTTVKLRLPRIPAPASSPAPKVESSVVGPLDVLLVDDEEDVRILVSRMLKRAGLRVNAVASGQEALAHLSSNPAPDLIILDQNMPFMNGIETLEHIRKLLPEVTVLVSSGQPFIEEFACFQQKNVATISKPFDMWEFLAKVGQIMPAVKPGTEA